MYGLSSLNKYDVTDDINDIFKYKIFLEQNIEIFTGNIY